MTDELVEGSDFQPREIARLGRDALGIDKRTDGALTLDVDYVPVKKDRFDGDNLATSGGLRRRSSRNVAGNGRRDGLKTRGIGRSAAKYPCRVCLNCVQSLAGLATKLK